VRRLSEIELQYIECLTSIMVELVEDQWPSREKIAQAVGYAQALGVSVVDVDALTSLADL